MVNYFANGGASVAVDDRSPVFALGVGERDRRAENRTKWELKR